MGRKVGAQQPQGPGGVLTVLRTRGPATITEVASELGLSRSTVIARLNALIDLGLVSARDASVGLRGRPATLYEFDPSAAVLLVAQIGMSAARLSITDLSGFVLATEYFEVDLSDVDSLASRCIGCFDGLRRRDPAVAGSIAGIGLGLPSTIETLDYVRSLGGRTSEWNPEPFGAMLGKHYSAPVYMDRDVNLLGVSERRTSWPEAETLVSVKLGTLIDSAIIVNGVAVVGAGNVAGNLGHVKVMGSLEACTCGGVGCLDAVASGSALVRQLQERGLAVANVADLVALAQAGHPAALQVIRVAGRRIGEALSAVVNLLNPQVIAFSGYLSAVEPTLFAGIRQGLYEHALPSASESLELVLPNFGEAAGTRGAVMHVIDRVLDESYVDAVVTKRAWVREETGLHAKTITPLTPSH